MRCVQLATAGRAVLRGQSFQARLDRPGRARIRFQDGTFEPPHAVKVVRERHQQGRSRSTVGFDRLAQHAQAERLMPEGKAYRLQSPGGALTRQWEATRFSTPRVHERRPASSRGMPISLGRLKPRFGLMLHAWEGGSGYSSCFCAARRMPPRTRYIVCSCYSDGPGWEV
jgi:hypothetical protein